MLSVARRAVPLERPLRRVPEASLSSLAATKGRGTARSALDARRLGVRDRPSAAALRVGAVRRVEDRIAMPCIGASTVPERPLPRPAQGAECSYESKA